MGDGLNAEVHVLNAKLDNFIVRTDDKLTEFADRLLMMKTSDELEANTAEVVKETEQNVMKKINNVDFKLSSKISDLIKTHLVRAQLIGPGADCPHKTLIDYSVGGFEKIEGDNKNFKNMTMKCNYEIGKIKMEYGKQIEEVLP